MSCSACEVDQQNWEGFCGYCQYLYPDGAKLHKHIELKHSGSVRHGYCVRAAEQSATTASRVL